MNTQGGHNNADLDHINVQSASVYDTDATNLQGGRPSVVARPGAGLPARAIPSNPQEYHVPHNTRQQAQANSNRPSVSTRSGGNHQHHYHMRSHQHRQGVFLYFPMFLLGSR